MSEESEQMKLIAFLETWGVDIKCHHSPNQRAGWKWGKKLKKMGVSKGFPDLVFFNQDAAYREQIIAIEMKSESGRLTQEQEKWMDVFSNLRNGNSYVARSAKEALQILHEEWPDYFSHIPDDVWDLIFNEVI